MKSPLRIMLADDHTFVRAGLRAMIERQPGWQVVGEAADGRTAIELAEKTAPDVAIIDISMPNLNGIEATKQITERCSRTAVVIVSMYADESYLLRSLKAGAKGYLLKDAPESDLIQAVVAVHSGKAFFSPAISKLLVDDYVRQLQQGGQVDSYELVTHREREVLQLLAEGKSNKEAAQSLFLSVHTVEAHRKSIFQKLNFHSYPELLMYAVRKGLIR